MRYTARCIGTERQKGSIEGLYISVRVTFKGRALTSMRMLLLCPTSRVQTHLPCQRRTCALSGSFLRRMFPCRSHHLHRLLWTAGTGTALSGQT
jgi:hypothetical protein